MHTYMWCMEHVHASLVAQQVKDPPASAGDVRSIPGPERSPGEGNGNPLPHSSILAWEIPRTEQPDRLQSWGRKSCTRLSDY